MRSLLITVAVLPRVTSTCNHVNHVAVAKRNTHAAGIKRKEKQFALFVRALSDEVGSELYHLNYIAFYSSPLAESIQAAMRST